MPPTHEPRLARAAALVADPARSRMLAYLLGGEFASAGELAVAASVSAATASGHLRKLMDGHFLVCEARGRHRYFRLADADVAHALEALALVSEREPHNHTWSHPQRQRLRQARCCYGHLAGQLSVRLFDTMMAEACLEDAPEGLTLTPAGDRWLKALGMTPSAPSKRRRYAYRCLDWSERRDHLAGQLADEMLAHFIHMGWLKRDTGRILELTPRGIQQWMPTLAR
jgi:DNA-binding transcriptional ArsR family regulator